MRILLAGTTRLRQDDGEPFADGGTQGRGLDVAPLQGRAGLHRHGLSRAGLRQAEPQPRQLFDRAGDLPTLLSRPADITVIEGVMGYYDSMDATSCRQSTWEMARLTRTPVLLVVDASGSAASAAATVKGFMTLQGRQRHRGRAGQPGFRRTSLRIGARRGGALHRPAVRGLHRKACESGAQEPPSGACARRRSRTLPRIQEAARQVPDTPDLPMILELARRAPVLPSRRGISPDGRLSHGACAG